MIEIDLIKEMLESLRFWESLPTTPRRRQYIEELCEELQNEFCRAVSRCSAFPSDENMKALAFIKEEVLNG